MRGHFIGTDGEDEGVFAKVEVECHGDRARWRIGAMGTDQTETVESNNHHVVSHLRVVASRLGRIAGRGRGEPERLREPQVFAGARQADEWLEVCPWCGGEGMVMGDDGASVLCQCQK